MGVLCRQAAGIAGSLPARMAGKGDIRCRSAHVHFLTCRLPLISCASLLPVLCSYAAPLHKVKTDDMLPIKLLTPFQVNSRLSVFVRLCGCMCAWMCGWVGEGMLPSTLLIPDAGGRVGVWLVGRL